MLTRAATLKAIPSPLAVTSATTRRFSPCFGNGAPVCGTSRVRARRKRLKTSTMSQTVRYGISRDRFTTRPQPAQSVWRSRPSCWPSAGNMVGNIQGGGQPWSTLGGETHVNLGSGHVEFEVRGLVLAGGNSIGTPDAINQVKGTIVCGAGSPTQAVVDTPLVPLSAQGDAEFDGNVGHFPAVCAP